MPISTASSKLFVDVAVISLTLATVMAFSFVVMPAAPSPANHSARGAGCGAAIIRAREEIPMIRKLRSALVRGLVVVLPIGFTIWLLWWLGSSTEALLRRLILLAIPPERYLPGMGIAAALLLLLAAGTLFNALLVQSALASWERFLDRIPVVKTIYGAARDFMKLLPTGRKGRDLRRVVLARFGDRKSVV